MTTQPFKTLNRNFCAPHERGSGCCSRSKAPEFDKYALIFRRMHAVRAAQLRTGPVRPGSDVSVTSERVGQSLTRHGVLRRVHPRVGGRDGEDEGLALRRAEAQQLGAVQHRN